MLQVLVTIAAAKGPPATGMLRAKPTPLPMPRLMVGRPRSLLQPGPAKYKAATETMDWAFVMDSSPAVAVVVRRAEWRHDFPRLRRWLVHFNGFVGFDIE
jgi:hypothetical protein